MPVAQGLEVYTADDRSVVARGFLLDQAELDEARSERLPQILRDQAGRNDLESLFASFDLTEFGSQILSQVLQPLEEEEHSRGWREGEALAEAWLVDHKECEFPWPFNRDLRHHRASLPGAELVGFTGTDVSDSKLAFGQVKTSKESQTPPQVVNRGEKCLISQALQLRDNYEIKKTLLEYLAYRAQTGVSWTARFRVAAQKCLNSGFSEIAVFGVLVRDVAPDARDLAGAASALRTGCNALTRIELFGLYLPVGCIPSGPQHGPRQRRVS